MARIRKPTERLTPEARELLERLAAKRGHVDAMYRTMLLNPGLTEAVSTLGGHLRFGSTALGDRERELAILWVARATGAAYEWVEHEPKARQAGIDQRTLDALRRGEDPELDQFGRDVVEVARLVLAREPIPAAPQARLVAELGEPGLLELAVLVGFYAMIAGFAAAFDVPLPDWAERPF